MTLSVSRILLVLATSYASFALALWAGQEAVLFPGQYTTEPWSPRHVRWAEVIDLTRSDGSAFPILLANPGHDRVVVLAHGNGEAAAQLGVYAEALHARGFATALLEYRGFAGLEGRPTEAGLAEDLGLLLDELQGRGFTRERTVLHGRSIGGGVAGTALDRAAGLVLESSFDSLRNTALERTLVRLVPVDLLLRSPMDTAARVAGRDLPVLQVHDRTDPVVSIARAEALRGGLSRGTWVETHGHPHGTPIVLVDPDVRETWHRWLDEVVPPSGP